MLSQNLFLTGVAKKQARFEFKIIFFFRWTNSVKISIFSEPLLPIIIKTMRFQPLGAVFYSNMGDSVYK